MTRVPCPFALTKFSWLNPMPDVGEILRYLENQPSIEHLHIAYAPIGNINLAPGALPRLKQLAAQLSMAMTILPGRKVNCLNLNLESPFPVHLSQAMEDALGHIQFLNCFTSKTTFILPGICFMHNLRWLRLSFPLGSKQIQQINLLDDIRDLLQVITERTTHLAYIQFPAWGTLKDLERQILQSVPPSCLVDIEGRQGGVFNRYYAGKQISLVFEGVSPTSATWWWTEDKLQRVLGKSPQALADPPRLAHLSPTLRDRTAASTLADFRSSATQPIVSLFSFVMVTKPSGRPTPLSHFPGQATDEPTSNHRWSEVIPPDTGLTFAVIWDPEDGLLAFSGAELLGSSANYFPDSRPISPSEALDGQSQVITLKTLSSGNVLTETPATLAFFRDTHRFLFAGSRSRLSSAKRPRHGARTQTSSTIGGMDVYLRGSLLGRAHKDQTHYSCFDLLEQDFEVKPFNDLTKTDSTESLEMRYNRAFSIFQAEHNLVSTSASQGRILALMVGPCLEFSVLDYDYFDFELYFGQTKRRRRGLCVEDLVDIRTPEHTHILSTDARTQ
ncbi:hypothetical protein EYR36_005140 [Pleurotus pulmonarius]|nr:hypothetical protein EYR36_005140 [Pleurotus pulmonarius]